MSATEFVLLEKKTPPLELTAREIQKHFYRTYERFSKPWKDVNHRYHMPITIIVVLGTNQSYLEHEWGVKIPLR